MSDDKPFTVRVPDEITELDNDKLNTEIQHLTAHEDANVLTDNQRTYLNNLRDELYKRVSTGGPYADYEGGSGQ